MTETGRKGDRRPEFKNRVTPAGLPSSVIQKIKSAD